MAQCVAISSIASQPVIVPDDGCTAGLVLVDAAGNAALAQSPGFIPIADAPLLMFSSVGLIIVAWVMRMAAKTLD